MTTNREVLRTDPGSTPLKNLGVAKIGRPASQAEWDVLEYELKTFVCEGEYEHGLERILTTFVTQLDQAQQPAAWVSGFFGSGKSQLVKVLDAIWCNLELPGGAAARGLTNLPPSITDRLTELSRLGKTEGGLWSAAGTLSSGAGTSVRLAMLEVIFAAAGLPVEYPLARFVLWLRSTGALQKVEEALAQQQTSLADELPNMYVSGLLAEALIVANPGLADSTAAVHSLLEMQYPMVTEISNADFLAAIDAVLRMQSTNDGKLPLTLLIFDEMQQFLAGNQMRVLELQEIVQVCSSHFESRLLFVATGQAALESTPELQKLQARFSVKVMLSDSDVDKVVRQVVLRKDEAHVPELRAVLDQVSGEIAKHLGGSRIKATGADQADLVADYPLLPTRRRFWEAVLRSIDSAGTAGQLRTQLRIVHDATLRVADRDLGFVIAGDALYDELENEMRSSGILTLDTQAIIRKQDDGSSAGVLRARICKLIFLIGKLETRGLYPAGVTATVSTLADLLVEDLREGSSALRQRLPELLRDLTDEGLVMEVGDGEYRLQTKESAEWQGAFQKHRASIRNDAPRITSERTNALRGAAEAALKGLKLQQGASNVGRKWRLHYGSAAPPHSSTDVAIWVRDGWDTAPGVVEADARTAGTDSPTVFVFIPRDTDATIDDAIAGATAAQSAINERPAPTTPEGNEALASMQARVQSERGRLGRRIGEVLGTARVYQGGGNEVARNSLFESVEAAADASVVRLYPKFNVADNPAWGKVVEKARAGSPDALSLIGHNGDPDIEPVCREVRMFVGPAGKPGRDVRSYFEAAPYGWSRDAVDGALLSLLAGGLLHGTLNGQATVANGLSQTQISSVIFAREETVITLAQRMAIRGLGADTGFPVASNQEAAAIAPILQRLLDMADRTGGEAPLPPPLDSSPVRSLTMMGGNEQFAAVAAQREELASLFRACEAREKAKAARQPRWEQMQRLLHHAGELAVAAEVQVQADAIVANRSLLAEPDPVAPLMQQLTDGLRAELLAARGRLAVSRDEQVAALEASNDWQRLEAADRDGIIAGCGLGAVAEVQVADPASLLASLDATPLKDWENKLFALPGRIANAREMAARKLQPKAVRVTLPGATLSTPDEVERYLAQARAEILGHIEAGNPVIL